MRKLQAAGLVVRTPSAQDARAIVISLSPRGQELQPALCSTWQDLVDQTVSLVEDTDVNELIATLSAMARGLASGQE